MAALTTYLAVASLALTAVGTVKAGQEAKKQSKAQAKALESQQNADELRQARERRQQVREARIRAGQAAQNAANQGAETSSSAIGGQASIASQLSANLSFLDQQGNINKQTTSYNLQANKAGASAQSWGGVANLGSTIFSASGDFGTIFGDAAPATQESTYSNNMGWIDWNNKA
jgi:preprotein translocase subunit SecF